MQDRTGLDTRENAGQNQDGIMHASNTEDMLQLVATTVAAAVTALATTILGTLLALFVGKVDTDVTAIDFLTVQLLNSKLGSLRGREGDEANPRERPVSRSSRTTASTTSPNWEKTSERDALLVDHERFPTV
ncbi:hypothetical protein BASA81_007210 [Batrachochytrium salamandrivorans]|nr:hypothetical protein BASA81_007210 [Batrachochytrium salamandrivorans]